jgi:YidC/Oxa1 family membrane protein insertase
VQHHLPQAGAFGKLYKDICGSAESTKACGQQLSKSAPAAMHFLGMDLNATARDATGAGAIPYYVIIALVALTGWYQVKQTQARQLQSGNSPVNKQMQAMTKIFPVFFAFICLGLNAGAILYFVISNVWRIGQQHLVIGKLYDQAISSGEIKPAVPPPKDKPDSKRAAPDEPTGNGKAKPGPKGQPPKGQPPKGQPAKGQSAKGQSAKGQPPNKSGTDANGNGNKGQGMSSGARRKKRPTMSPNSTPSSGSRASECSRATFRRGTSTWTHPASTPRCSASRPSARPRS